LEIVLGDLEPPREAVQPWLAGIKCQFDQLKRPEIVTDFKNRSSAS
jgi:hypothetical protein